MMAKPATPAAYFDALKQFAAKKGLFFNPDENTVRPLIDGLWENKQRYGYPSCPCRLACEQFDGDRDIICPCAYAPADIDEYGQCYCGLYVHETVVHGHRQLQHVPERRPAEKFCL